MAVSHVFDLCSNEAHQIDTRPVGATTKADRAVSVSSRNQSSSRFSANVLFFGRDVPGAILRSLAKPMRRR
jgi:hypothetical protein